MLFLIGYTSQKMGTTVAKTGFKSVDEYIASQPEAVRGVLKRVRSAIRKAVPEAEEVISYQIPACRLTRSPSALFRGVEQHYSLYPATRSRRRSIQERLGAV